jgi:hypothetical protein
VPEGGIVQHAPRVTAGFSALDPELAYVPAVYLGEIGERELTAMSGGDVEGFLRAHDADLLEEPITLDMVPPHAPPEGEAWDSTIHHFRCATCGWISFCGTRTSAASRRFA